MGWTEDHKRLVGVGEHSESQILGKMVVNFKIDYSTSEGVIAYVVSDTTLPKGFIFGRQWLESPNIAYYKFNNV